MECGCLHGRVVNLKMVAHAVLSSYGLCSLMHVGVWAHILGDPQSVEPRNATITITVHKFEDSFVDSFLL